MLIHSVTLMVWMALPREGVSINAPGGVEEYCETDIFHAECPSDHVIMIDSAEYGRMRRGRCVDRDYGYVGCSIDVMSIADSWCSGRQECRIPIPNSAFRKTQPCPNDLKPYFETSYSCMRVVTGKGQACRGGEHVTVTSQHGYLAKVITVKTQHGSADCPWKLRASPGQTLNITLWDFAVTPSYSISPGSYNDGSPIGVCHVTAVIRERPLARGHTVCGGEQRIKHVYTSQTNEVDIRILGGNHNSDNNAQYFLLEFKALGCADLPPHDNTWMRRQGDNLEVGCSGSDIKWRLTCIKGVWSGERFNCTREIPFAGDVMLGSIVMPFEVSIFVIVAIALLIGVVILSIGLFLLRWRIKSKRNAKAARKNIQTEASHTLYDVKPVNSYTNNHPAAHGGLPSVPTYDVGGYTEENEYAYISEVLPPPGQGYNTKDTTANGNTLNSSEAPPIANHSNSTAQRHVMQTFSNPGALMDESLLPPSPRHEPVSLPRYKNTTPSLQQTPIKNNVLPRLLAHECALNVKNEPQQNYGMTHANPQAMYGSEGNHHCGQLPTYYELDPHQQAPNGQRVNYSSSPSHMPTPNKTTKVYAVQRNDGSFM